MKTKTTHTQYKGTHIEIYCVPHDHTDIFMASAVVEQTPFRWDVLTTSGLDTESAIAKIQAKIDNFFSPEK